MAKRQPHPGFYCFYCDQNCPYYLCDRCGHIARTLVGPSLKPETAFGDQVAVMELGINGHWNGHTCEVKP